MFSISRHVPCGGSLGSRMFALARSYGLSTKTRNSDSTVGDRFSTVDEIKEYLNNKTQKITLRNDTSTAREEPSNKTVENLLKLSGFSVKDDDTDMIETVKRTLSQQIFFINKLHEIEIEPIEYDNNVKFARLMPRNNKPMTYQELMNRISHDNSQTEPELENNTNWNPTDLATESENNYFILNNGLLTNRE